jgi:hypothetical protein
VQRELGRALHRCGPRSNTRHRSGLHPRSLLQKGQSSFAITCLICV